MPFWLQRDHKIRRGSGLWTRVASDVLGESSATSQGLRRRPLAGMSLHLGGSPSLERTICDELDLRIS